RLDRSSIRMPVSAARGLERLVVARSRLLEGAPQTRREIRQRWLNKVVQPGRVVAVGRSGRRLALITGRGRDGATAVREDGRSASFPLQRIGRVFAPIFSMRPDKIDEAFDEVHHRADALALAEPRLRDIEAGEEDS